MLRPSSVSLLALLLLAACGRAEAPAVDPPPQAPTAAESARSAESAVTASADGPEGAASPWEAARARGVAFRAVGQEPGWVLEVYNDSLVVLEADYGTDRLAMPIRATLVTGNEFSFDGRPDGRMLSVVAVEAPCRDTMSGEAYPATVTVRLDGERSLQGCGRAL
ncbi:MAG: COG3650 family protein [Rubricoccaceae bacterium]